MPFGMVEWSFSPLLPQARLHPEPSPPRGRGIGALQALRRAPALLLPLLVLACDESRKESSPGGGSAREGASAQNVASAAASASAPAEESLGHEGSRQLHPVHLEGRSKRSVYLDGESRGLSQSPINIVSSRTVAGHHNVHLHYKTSREHVANLGHTVKVSVDPGSSLEFDGREYDLAQFHFHTPSEHLIDGMTYPMEMHIVHTLRGEPETYLVVGVLFKEGRKNPLLKTLLAAVPGNVGATVDIEDVRLDAGILFSESEHYYHYEGSLTTPPYTESVTWLVLRNVHTASPEQIETINRFEGDNARHIQQLQTRTVDVN